MAKAEFYRRFADYKPERNTLVIKTKGLRFRYYFGLCLTILYFISTYLVFLNEKIRVPFDKSIRTFIDESVISKLNHFIHEHLYKYFYTIKYFPEETSASNLFIAIVILILYFKLILDIIYDNKRYLTAEKSFFVTAAYSWALFILLEWLFAHPLNAEIYAAMITAIFIELLKFNKYYGWHPSIRNTQIFIVSALLAIKWIFGEGANRVYYKNEYRKKYILKKAGP